jgi:hypothetical protein
MSGMVASSLNPDSFQAFEAEEQDLAGLLPDAIDDDDNNNNASTVQPAQTPVALKTGTNPSPPASAIQFSRNHI